MESLSKFGVTLHKKKLANGANLFLFERKGMPIYIRTSFFAGSRFDTVHGTAHFLEHMLMAGTERFPSKNLVADYIQKVGGEFGASTNSDILRFNLEIPESQDLHTGIEVLSECLTKSLFDKKTIESERGAILSELKSKKSHPKEYIHDVSKRLTMQKTSVQGSVLGSETEVGSINKANLVGHAKDFINTGRMVFVVSGDVDFEYLASGLDTVEIPTSEPFKITENLPVFSDEKKAIEVYPGLTQLQVILSCRITVENYKEHCALRVVNQIMSLGRGSQLVTKLRYENGLVYSVSGNIFNTADWGVWSIMFSCDKNNYDKAIGLIFEEFGSLKKNNVSAIELENTKSRISKGLIRTMQTSESWVTFHENDCLYTPDKVRTVEDYTKTVEALTLEDISRVINKYLNKENFYTAICGDV